jgi:L-rhamnose mutarotase
MYRRPGRQFDHEVPAMTVKALHTRLRPDAVERYDALHTRVPADLLVALGEAGVQDWRIWRTGQDVFHILTVDDYPAMRAHLRDHPANLAWQAQVVPLQELPDDYSGADDGLPFVWSYAEQVAKPTAVAED